MEFARSLRAPAKKLGVSGRTGSLGALERVEFGFRAGGRRRGCTDGQRPGFDRLCARRGGLCEDERGVAKDKEQREQRAGT